MLAAPSSNEYSEWTCRCAQAWVLTGWSRLGAPPDGAGGSRRTLRGVVRSSRQGAVDPRLQQRDGLAIAAHGRAVPGRGGLATEQVAIALGGHRHGGVGALDGP